MALRTDGLPNIQRQFHGLHTTTIVSPLARDVRHIAVPDLEMDKLGRSGVVVSKLSSNDDSLGQHVLPGQTAGGVVVARRRLSSSKYIGAQGDWRAINDFPPPQSDLWKTPR